MSNKCSGKTLTSFVSLWYLPFLTHVASSSFLHALSFFFNRHWTRKEGCRGWKMKPACHTSSSISLSNTPPLPPSSFLEKLTQSHSSYSALQTQVKNHIPVSSQCQWPETCYYRGSWVVKTAWFELMHTLQRSSVYSVPLRLDRVAVEQRSNQTLACVSYHQSVTLSCVSVSLNLYLVTFVTSYPFNDM